jgi:hypothetical protein
MNLQTCYSARVRPFCLGIREGKPVRTVAQVEIQFKLI